MKAKKMLGMCCVLSILAAMTVGCAAQQGTSSAPAAELSSAVSSAPSSGGTQQESEEDLYQQALKNSDGKITVYTASTKITNTAKASFEEQYPGLTVEVNKFSTKELISKLIEEQNAGLYNTDFVLVKEQGGNLKHDLVDTGMVEKYLPDDIAKNMVKPYDQNIGYPVFIMCKTVAYNTDALGECPVTNWWDLTEPQWKGRIFINDPAKGGPQMDFICGFLMNPDEMASAYVEKYGEEPDLEGEENAGYLFVKKFAENIRLTTDDQVMYDAVANSTKEDPKIAVTNSNDMQDFLDEDLPITVTWDMVPKLAVENDTYLFVAKNASNPEGAKLLIRWMAGGADGKAEGVSASVKHGSFVPVSTPYQTQSVQLGDVKMFSYDSDSFYKDYVKMVDFWNSLQ